MRRDVGTVLASVAFAREENISLIVLREGVEKGGEGERVGLGLRHVVPPANVLTHAILQAIAVAGAAVGRGQEGPCRLLKEEGVGLSVPGILVDHLAGGGDLKIPGLAPLTVERGAARATGVPHDKRVARWRALRLVELVVDDPAIVTTDVDSGHVQEARILLERVRESCLKPRERNGHQVTHRRAQ